MNEQAAVSHSSSRLDKIFCSQYFCDDKEFSGLYIPYSYTARTDPFPTLPTPSPTALCHVYSGNRAARKNDATIPRALIREDAKSATGGSGRESHYLAACRALLTSGANVKSKDAQGRTPLALAAASGSLEVVTMLLQNGADPTVTDSSGNTPMHFAFAYAHAAIAAALARGGGDFDHRNKDGHTPQDVAGQGGRFIASSGAASADMAEEKPCV